VSTSAPPTEVARNVGLDQLAKLLQDQSTRKLDVIAGSGAVRAVGGQLVLDDTEPQLGPEGVTMTTGAYTPNDVANQGIADKLGIPGAYLRRLVAENVDLYDDNVNSWLSRTDRRFLIRVLRNDSGGGVCRNGMVIHANRMRRTHLGSRQEEDGVIEWSDATNTKTLELITARTRDAVAAYLDAEYVTRMVRDLEAVAGKPVENPDTTIKIVAQRLRLPDEAAATLLAHFIKGGDLTAGGVMHAVTSVAQTMPDADAAYEMEAAGVQAMHIAANA
jgi:hypothetical protein